MSLRFSREDLSHFIISLDPCYRGLKDFFCHVDDYMDAFKTWKQGGGVKDQVIEENWGWVRDCMNTIVWNKKHLHVLAFNDDFFKALKRCNLSCPVQRLELFVARWTGEIHDSEWSPGEYAALEVPRNVYSKDRRWYGREFAGRYGIVDGRYLKIIEDGEYDVRDLRKMTAEELKGTYFTVQSKKEGK